MSTPFAACQPFIERVERLGARPGLVLALLLVVNAIVLPYRGLHHDARLYAAGVHEKLAPGSLADDLYLRYGSQDRYTAFSLVLAPLAQAIGLEPAFFLAYLASKVLFFWALVRLVFALVPERVPALASLVYLAMAPLPFGGNEVIHLNESFLTPRIASSGLVLLALERILAGRFLTALLLCLAAGTLHPVMALAGLLVVLVSWLPRVLPAKALLALACLVALAGILIITIEPLGKRLFGHMDEDWYEVCSQICFFIDPAAWSAGDWQRLALAAGIVTVAAFLFGHDRINLPAAVLIVGAAGLVGTLVGVHGRYLLLIQASPFRTLWLTELLAIPLGFRLCAFLMRQERPLLQAAGPALLVLLTTDFNRGAFPPVLAFLLVIPVCLLVCRGKPDGIAWTGWLALGGCAALLLVFNVHVAAQLFAHPPTFDVDLYPLRVLLSLGEFLFKLPLVLLVLGVAAWMIPRLRWAVALVVLWLGYQTTLAWLDASPEFAAKSSIRHQHVRFVAGFLKEHQKAKGRPLTVYWTTDLRDIWYRADAQSYLNTVQMSGCGYTLATALEGRRRARLTSPFECAWMHRVPLPENWWHEAMLAFFGNPPPRKPTEADLRALAAEENLDYIIIEEDFPGLHVASTGRFFLYDCARLRKPATDLPLRGERISMTPGPPKPGGNNGNQPANK
jgi:hypothetical protein